jgi:hypothetical protein
VAADAAMLAEILCVEVERVVGRDNTVSNGFFGRTKKLTRKELGLTTSAPV